MVLKILVILSFSYGYDFMRHGQLPTIGVLNLVFLVHLLLFFIIIYYN